MANLLLLMILCVSISHSQAQSLAESFLLPVSKDHSTLQYFTTVSHGTPLLPTNLVVDLGGPFLWLDCPSSRDSIPSSSALPTPHRSIRCLTATTPHHHHHHHPSAAHPCHVFPENTITGTVATQGELVQDLMSLHPYPHPSSSSQTHLLLQFTCSPTPLLRGLANGAKGMLGLGRFRTSLTSQLFDSFATHRKLTLCLSSSTGVFFFGPVSHQSQPFSDILRSLAFTPLLTNPNQRSQEYLINVNAVKINGKRLPLLSVQDGVVGGTHTLLSSIVPYTAMHSTIYSAFKAAFLEAAVSMNMTKVAPVAPFQLCFSSTGIGGSQLGPNVPIIELVLQSEMVKWTVYGRNSMVKVSDQVLCLGFVDGGLKPRNSIVIGGYQLEDVIVQFDLATSMVGFSPSLLAKNITCSDFGLGSLPPLQSA